MNLLLQLHFVFQIYILTCILKQFLQSVSRSKEFLYKSGANSAKSLETRFWLLTYMFYIMNWLDIGYKYIRQYFHVHIKFQKHLIGSIYWISSILNFVLDVEYIFAMYTASTNSSTVSLSLNCWWIRAYAHEIEVFTTAGRRFRISGTKSCTSPVERILKHSFAQNSKNLHFVLYLLSLSLWIRQVQDWIMSLFLFG